MYSNILVVHQRLCMFFRWEQRGDAEGLLQPISRIVHGWLLVLRGGEPTVWPQIDLRKAHGAHSLIYLVAMLLYLSQSYSFVLLPATPQSSGCMMAIENCDIFDGMDTWHALPISPDSFLRQSFKILSKLNTLCQLYLLLFFPIPICPLPFHKICRDVWCLTRKCAGASRCCAPSPPSTSVSVGVLLDL